ncbi:MAG: NAD(+) kinase [Candelina submexicana]|nr:MAG: NAD(+) kinase [Candelina submexicana]
MASPFFSLLSNQKSTSPANCSTPKPNGDLYGPLVFDRAALTNDTNYSKTPPTTRVDDVHHPVPLITTTQQQSSNSDDTGSTISTATTRLEERSPQDPATSLPASPYFSHQAPKWFLNHRKNVISVDALPRRTIMKALASRPPIEADSNLSIAASLSGLMSAHDEPDEKAGNTYSQRLSAALSELQLGSRKSMIPLTARLPALQSPCFFHQRFDDAVDIGKVLEEIVEDEGMSHSRLMQTATGVREVSKQLQRRPIRRAVRNVMIVTKARDNDLVTLTRDLAEWLLSVPRYGSDLGVNVYVDSKLRKSKRFNAAGLLEKEPRFEHMLKYWTPDLCWTSPENFDLVLTLGGDGTVLFTSWLFQRIVPPILSFSLGSLGFLTNFQFNDYKEHLNRVMGEAGMRVNLRMRFTCTVYRHASNNEMREAEQFEVLNELVIDRGPSPYVSNLELYGDNELLTVVQADGCIFSTPTGSTAYSLSAGGSLVHPDIPAILLTPICPHTLSFRPMVLSDSMLLRVCVPSTSRATAYCSFDGKGRVELRQGDHVTIAASQYPFPTVLAQPTEWFDSLGRTLRWNTRGATQKGFGEGKGGEVEEEEEWDIDTADDEDGKGDRDRDRDRDRDSGIGTADTSTSVSPMRRQMSMLLG